MTAWTISSNMPEGLTLAPFGTAALLVDLLRSTAGSCFGRFIGFLLFVGIRRPQAMRARNKYDLTLRPAHQQANLDYRGGPLLRDQPTPMAN